MKYSFSLLVLAASIIFTSCVSKKQFTNLETDYNRLQTEQKDLQRNYQESQLQLAESRTRVASLEERLAEARKNNEDLRAAYRCV